MAIPIIERPTEVEETAHLLAWEHAGDFSEQQRWLSSKPDSFSADEHRWLFGVDVDNLRHGILQRKISEYMAARLDLPKEETEFLSLVGQYHDLGEFRKGDFDWSTKTLEAEKEEIDEFSSILYNDPHFTELGDDLKARMLRVIGDAKSPKPTTFEGLFHDASERTGYLRTQLVVASKQPKDWPEDLTAASRYQALNKLSPTERLNLQLMHMEVIGQHVHDLYFRHVAGQTNAHDIDLLVSTMLSDFAPRLNAVVQDLPPERYGSDFFSFKFERYNKKFEKDENREDPGSDAEEAAEEALTRYEKTYELLEHIN